MFRWHLYVCLQPVILCKKLVVSELLIGILAITGVYIIFDFHPQYKTGIIFGVIAAMGSAIFPVYNKQLLQRFSARVLTLYELGGGFIILTLLLPFYLNNFEAAYYLPSLQDWSWLIILAVLCTILSFDLMLNALKKISAFTVNLTYNLEPVYGIILAFIFFHENKSLRNEFFLGLALILTAVLLQMIRVSRQSKRIINK